MQDCERRCSQSHRDATIARSAAHNPSQLLGLRARLLTILAVYKRRFTTTASHTADRHNTGACGLALIRIQTLFGTRGTTRIGIRKTLAAKSDAALRCCLTPHSRRENFLLVFKISLKEMAAPLLRSCDCQFGCVFLDHSPSQPSRPACSVF